MEEEDDVNANMTHELEEPGDILDCSAASDDPSGNHEATCSNQYVLHVGVVRFGQLQVVF